MSLDDLRKQHRAWAKHNFHDREFQDVAEEIAQIGQLADMDTQAEAVRQVLFKRLGMFMPFVGMVEELGELAHALLKKRQGIRTGEDHDAAAKDAYADGRIFGYDLCHRLDWDDEEIVGETLEHVLRRDWVADPEKGGQ